MNTRPHWWHFKRWLKWQFDEWMQISQQSQTWGLPLQCLNCRSIVAKQAQFCQTCGQSLSSYTQGVGTSPNTGPMVRDVAAAYEPTQQLTPLSHQEYSAILAAIHAPTRFEAELIATHKHGERLVKTAARLHRLEHHS